MINIMSDLNPRARGIIDAFRYHEAGKAIAFWGVLIDEDGYIWSSDEDADVEFLVEHAVLRPAEKAASSFLKMVAADVKMTLNPRRVWQVTEQFKKIAA
jgi:hypothetical protein